MRQGELLLGTCIVVAQSDLSPLAVILADEIRLLTGKEISVIEGNAEAGDILLTIDKKLKGEAYALEVGQTASVQGGNYSAIAVGTVSLLHAMFAQDGVIKVPCMSLSDSPSTSYRGLLVDVARKPHSITTLEHCIVLCRWYKIRYLQLHLTDDQLFTFPSTAFPKLPSPGKAYTLEQLRGLEEYAKHRGVTIIPEFDVPGHSGAFVNAMPELFAVTGGARKGWSVTMNFAREDACRAIETIIEEMLEVFQSTPYFHIGADESNFAGFDQDTYFQEAYKKCGITGDLGTQPVDRTVADEPGKLIKPEAHPQAYELFLRFVSRLNDKVKSCGKQTLIWEGFSPVGVDKLPKDMIVMPYHMRNYKPNWLVEDGFSLINASATLYVVGGWPKPELKKIYEFNSHQFEWKDAAWKTMILPPSAPVLGAQMCSWEQAEDAEIPTLRQPLAVMSERLWITGFKKGFDDLFTRLTLTDVKLTALLGHKTKGIQKETKAVEESLPKPAEYRY